ncbi:Rpr2-domain-containing protein [Hypoxylon trugodes]|uniref:Rpr2-domain-containing protein n=1 Tax=Hypoxylon trugodes TaxID=326681 RepID=UPI00219F8B32|nr:Rpr2-domain-containing protein [Hypoxylon trugodes]KAI1392414.1 Rpr2-domain-containing protein [Hypoxylon trugodes]
MAKAKGSGTIPNRPIYSRISYLYQAAAYLANHPKTNESSVVAHSPSCLEGAEDETIAAATTKTGTKTAVTAEQDKQTPPMTHANRALSRRFVTDLRAASLKSQIRLSPTMKHTICKFCDSLLIEGETSTSTVENKSKDGKKPWADVLIVKCHTCGGLKRFPVQAPRQKRRPVREKEQQEKQAKEKQKTGVVMGEG